MLKLKTTKPDGTTVYLFGLSAMNIERLKEGKPIPVNLRELGGPNSEVLLFAGDTEATMLDDLVKAGAVRPEVAETMKAQASKPATRQ